jgi:hypothetical protein
MAFKGRCLCGAVSYQSSGPAVFMGNCYCADCRRESGTGHITAVAVPDSSLELAGETRDFTKPSDSGQSIRNTFCPVCGTTLCTHPSGLAGLALIRAGTLDDVSVVDPQINMYVARAPTWDKPAEGIMGFSGMAPSQAT